MADASWERGVTGRVSGTRSVTSGPISRGHFSLKGERGRQPKITPVGPPSQPKADQSLGHGLIESGRSGPVQPGWWG